MKSAFLTEPRNIEIRETGMPVVKAYEVLVRIAYCGICTLEQRLYDGQRSIGYPIVPGHEASGTVVSVGSEVIGPIKPGDHVVLDLVNRCHVCPACLSGNSNLCESRYAKGQQVLGAFSTYMAVKPQQIQVIPPSLPLEQAAFAEPLSCCIRSLRKVGASLGQTLLICGAGTMGLLHLKVALAIGVRVIVSDIDGKRLEDAARMGADLEVNPSDIVAFRDSVRKATDARGVECAIVTSCAPSAASSALEVLAPGGKLNIYTSYGDKPPLPVDMHTIHRNEYMITGSEGRNESDFFCAVRALAYGKIVVDDLISNIYPLDEVGAALEKALAGNVYRVLLEMQGT